MEILPARILAYKWPIQRKHNPQQAAGEQGYRQYRACLRWEFGFTCAMCLLHEADLVEHGAEGTGLSGVEHFEPQMIAPEEINEYENCLYICRYCNNSRGALPRRSPEGHSLLSPTSTVWGEHFEVQEHCLLPRPGDGDAMYTYTSYNLDDPRKVLIRKTRQENIDKWLRSINEKPLARQRMLEIAERREAEAPTEALTLRRVAELLRRDIIDSWKQLQRYRAIPEDHPASCRCKPPPLLQLPQALQEQVLRLTPPREVLESTT